MPLHDVKIGENLGLHRGDTAVCIPVFGAYDLFAQCLLSAVTHTEPDVPVLVCDDATPDPRLRSLLEEASQGAALAAETDVLIGTGGVPAGSRPLGDETAELRSIYDDPLNRGLVGPDAALPAHLRRPVLAVARRPALRTAASLLYRAAYALMHAGKPPDMTDGSN